MRWGVNVFGPRLPQEAVDSREGQSSDGWTHTRTWQSRVHTPNARGPAHHADGIVSIAAWDKDYRWYRILCRCFLRTPQLGTQDSAFPCCDGKPIHIDVSIVCLNEVCNRQERKNARIPIISVVSALLPRASLTSLPPVMGPVVWSYQHDCLETSRAAVLAYRVLSTVAAVRPQ